MDWARVPNPTTHQPKTPPHTSSRSFRYAVFTEKKTNKFNPRESLSSFRRSSRYGQGFKIGSCIPRVFHHQEFSYHSFDVMVSMAYGGSFKHKFTKQIQKWEDVKTLRLSPRAPTQNASKLNQHKASDAQPHCLRTTQASETVQFHLRAGH
jgi:hypothetical protein